MFKVAGYLRLGLGVWLWSTVASAQAPTTGSFPIDDSSAPAPSAAPPAPTAAPPTPPTAVAPTPPTAAPPEAPVAPQAPPAAAPPAVAAPALAQSEALPPSEDLTEHEYSGPHVSLTFSPLHLLLPMFEAQVEVLVVPHLGIAAIGGVGSVSAAASDPTLGNQKFSAYELGAQVVGYPLRDYSGLQLGAEFLWIHVSTETFAGQQVSAEAGGGAVGPLVGYKWLTKIGFTAFVQGGFEYLVVKSNAADDQGHTAEAKQSAFIPLLNFNLGWSF
ncbi:MAG TPA: hypothetical protein VNG33_12185 [Polyangiaceae bacterium]|nr:hypothetical protein [Polyangiaceae bacterium]